MWSVIKETSELSVINLLSFEYHQKTVRYLTVFRDLWRNQLWQWLEKGCRKPVLGVWHDFLVLITVEIIANAAET